MFIVIRKKGLMLIVLLLVAALTVPAAIYAASAAATRAKDARIIIDAGHGGVDYGVSGVRTKVKESDLTLELSKLINGYAESGGLQPLMTRKNSDGLYGLFSANFKRRDMEKRIKIIKSHNPEVVLSIHMNHYTASYRRGIQVFYSKASDEEFAACVQDYLNRTMNVPALGRGFTQMKGDYFISKQSPCPAIIVECGFLSNPEDEALILDADYRMLLAYRIFSATVLYLETKSPNN